MSHLFAALLPLALGAAVSPVVLMTEVLALSSAERPKLKGWLVVAGSGLILVAYELAILFVGAHLSANKRPHHLEDAIVGLGAAALLGWLLLKGWRSRGTNKGPGVLGRLAGAKPGAFFGIGMLIMLTNASTLILVLPAVRLINHAHVSGAEQAAALGLLTVFGLLPALAPAVLVSALGASGARLSAALNRFVEAHAAQLTMGLEAVFLVYFLVKGISGAAAL